MAEKYNLKNPAVKRILQELKEMQTNPSDDFMSLPLEDNIFEWQFAIRGPGDSEFEGGIYHGRIQLPVEYPLRPPAFMLLTPNGRFETQTKICLSISNYHPEHWQPSWSVRTALVALIAFMPTSPNGALGSLDFSKDERRALAIKSRDAPPTYGSPDRQKLIDEIHQYMLSKAPPVPQLTSNLLPASVPQIDENLQNGEHQVENTDTDVVPAVEGQNPPVEGNRDMVHEVRLNAEAGPYRVSISAGVRLRRNPAEQRELEQQQLTPTARIQRPSDDRFYTWAAVGLAVAIMFLLVKKYLKSVGFIAYHSEL